MNYFELEIGGKKRGFRFGLGFLGDILEHFDLDIGGFGNMLSKNPFKAVPAIIFFGHRYEQKKKGIVIDFTLIDVDEWVENLEDGYANEGIELMLQVLLESMRKNVPGLAEVEGEKKKSKLAG